MKFMHQMREHLIISHHICNIYKYLKVIISFHCVYSLKSSRFAFFSLILVYLLYSRHVFVLLRHCQSESCDSAVSNGFCSMIKMVFFVARPIMIVIEFMSKGSLDSFLQVWQATNYG